MNMSLRPKAAPSPVEMPPAPKSLADLGLPMALMRDILIKTMYRQNLIRLDDIASSLSISAAQTQVLVSTARDQRLIEITGSATESANDLSYQLTDAGKDRARDALSQSEYFGALPVPLAVFEEQVKRQSIRNTNLKRSQLEACMSHLILPEGLLDQLGPAVRSGRSILLYGPPGNGKSSISNGVRDAMGDQIYVPQAIEYSGQIIAFYDPLVHERINTQTESKQELRKQRVSHDTRFLLCRRPAVVTGGELTLSMLDLVYNSVSRTYQAPLQMKAAGGLFIVDDLGRQEESPQALINRWIVPMEEGKDILALQSGEKFTVPFDTLVIFSTNFHPNEIFDGAALRRIFYKIKINGPDQKDFLKIFALIARKKGLPLDEATLIYMLKEKYPSIKHVYANYQPGFLVDQIMSICDYEGVDPQMNQKYMDRAWANMFVKDEIIER
ncbi:MAG: ATPase [Halocynthiibacter sp.]